jgi:predicted phosphodiesterase
MRVAALYDVHGNLPAVEAVLREIETETETVELILVGGDVASGPMPKEALQLLRSLGDRVRFVRGNADRVLDFGVAGGGDAEGWKRARLWVAERLDADDLRFLDALPVDVALDVDRLGAVRFCHAAPGSDEEPITRLSPDDRVRRLLAGVRERIVVCGHTHVQFDRVVDGFRIVNAGSVGAPYEEKPGAYWLRLGPDVSLRRTSYDVASAAERIRATGYPNLAYLEELLVEDRGRPERMSALIERAM